MARDKWRLSSCHHNNTGLALNRVICAAATQEKTALYKGDVISPHCSIKFNYNELLKNKFKTTYLSFLKVDVCNPALYHPIYLNRFHNTIPTFMSKILPSKDSPPQNSHIGTIFPYAHFSS